MTALIHRSKPTNHCLDGCFAVYLPYRQWKIFVVIKMDSPCIASCKLNSDKICIGCYRHIEEIVDWNKRTEAEQLTIIASLSERKRQIDIIADAPTSAITQAEWQAAKSALALKRKMQLD